MKVLRSMALAACVSVAILFSGCAGLGGLIDDKGISAHFTIKSVSVLNGITVSIKGVDCNFSFTTNRDVLLEEVRNCVIGGNGQSGFLVRSASPMMGSSSGDVEPLPEPTVDETEVVDITEAILKQAQAVESK